MTDFPLMTHRQKEQITRKKAASSTAVEGSEETWDSAGALTLRTTFNTRRPQGPNRPLNAASAALSRDPDLLPDPSPWATPKTRAMIIQPP